MTPLQDETLLVTLATAAAAGHQSSTCGVFKDLSDTLVGSGRALKVLVAANLLANLLTLVALVIANSSVSSSLTSSGETGFWLVFRNSSMVFWS
jgi:hypothetical protein